MAITVVGLWSFTNLEMAYALLRVDERAGTFLRASLTNVAITIALSVYLVVFRDQGARGLLAGQLRRLDGRAARRCCGCCARASACASTACACRRCCASGCPTVPAEVSVFALNIIDRLYLYRVESEAAAGLYSLAVKLAAVVILATRAFQYAWPPLAYSIRDDDEARRVYALVIATYYVLGAGLVVAALTLLGRWAVRLLAAPEFFAAHRALPWVALGWALYGLFLVLVVMAGRAGVTTRNFPAALRRAWPSTSSRCVVLVRPPWASPAPGSRCAWPTSSCSPPCTCSPAACSRWPSSGAAWRRPSS